MDTKLIDEKIAKVKQQLDQVIAEANRQIGYYQGQLALLEQIKKEQEPEDANKTT